MFALEKQLGMGNGTIGKWGKNGRVPNYAKLSAVCSALGVSVDDVMSGEPLPGKKENAPAPKGESDHEKLLIELFRQLSPERQEEELAYLTQAAKREAGRDM